MKTSIIMLGISFAVALSSSLAAAQALDLQMPSEIKDGEVVMVQ